MTNNNRGSTQRRGGKRVGQLAPDSDIQGRQKELDIINKDITYLVKTYFPHMMGSLSKFLITLDMYRMPLARFNLSSHETTKPGEAKYLVPFEMKSPNLPDEGACKPYIFDLETKTNSSGFKLKNVLANAVCQTIENEQRGRIIDLHINDIMTSLPDMWFNSPAIDAYINYIKEFTAEPEAWYIVSAEDSPERRDRLKEIAKTPKCYKYILSPLYREHHWTVMCIDHVNQIVYYLNSDVVDKQTPEIQTEPFKRLFPGYKLIVIPCVKQCDNSSCGTYVCNWCRAFLFLVNSNPKSRETLLHTSCSDILRFRTVIRRQLLLSYYVCPLSGVKSF
jgi:hypothetical protein